MIKLCIFDMDGLLLDSERAMWTPSQTVACKEQGFTLTDEIHSLYMGMNFKDVKPIFEKYFKGVDFERIINRTLELNDIRMEKPLPLMRGAIELIDYLRANGIKTCIGTSTKRVATEKILNVLGIRDKFDGVVCGDDIVNGKPAPDIYLKAHSLFDCKKEETLVFEDAGMGGKAAIAAGLRLILVPDLAKIDEDIKKQAFKVISHLDEAIDIIKEENETTSSI